MITFFQSSTSFAENDDDSAAGAAAAAAGQEDGACSPAGAKVGSKEWGVVTGTSSWLPCCPGLGWAKVQFSAYYECVASEADKRDSPKARARKLAAVRKVLGSHKHAPKYPASAEKIMLFAFAFETMDAATTPSYGAQPWIPLFLRSAEASGVNYTLIGNIGTLYGAMPPNVKLVPMTYAEFIRKATVQLFAMPPLNASKFDETHRELLFNTPFGKADDFKPLLASFFKEELEGFAWWGYCDVDMFVGNIRRVLQQQTLDEYDVISPVATSPGLLFQTWSAFSMFRNTPQLVNMFKQADSEQLLKLLLAPAVGNFASNGALSISSLLLLKISTNGIRLLHDGVPFGWDAKCTDLRTGMVGKTRCNECVFAVNKHGDGMVVHDHGLTTYVDVVLCHFRIGKPALAWRMDQLDGRGNELVANANLIFQSFPEGFRAHVPGSHHRKHNAYALGNHEMPKILRETATFLGFGVQDDADAAGVEDGAVDQDTDDEGPDLRSAARPSQPASDDAINEEESIDATEESESLLDKLRDRATSKSGAAIALAKAEAVQKAAELDNYAAADDKDDADDKAEDDDKSGEAIPPPRIMLFTLIFGDSAANNPWLRIFLRSAAYSGVNYTIVGSPAVPFYLPDNVQQIEITLQEIVGLLEKKVFDGESLTELKNITYYKAIDFKPLLGYLFQDPYLYDFDWWGHIDNDMMMGNVRKFLPAKLLQHFDVVSPLETFAGDMFRTWGPFNMYRNNAKINTLFKLAGSKLRKLFAIPDGMWFDEWAQGNHDKYDKNNILTNVSMTHIINEHGARLGVRVLGPETSKMPFMWDGLCHDGIGHHCGECRQRITAFGELRQHMYLNGRWFPVILCHYQMGKAGILKHLQAMKDSKWERTLSENQMYIGGFSLDAINIQHWDESIDIRREAERIRKMEARRDEMIARKKATQLMKNKQRILNLQVASRNKRMAKSADDKRAASKRLKEKRVKREAEAAMGGQQQKKKQKIKT